MDYEFTMKYKLPSLISAAVMYISFELLGVPIWQEFTLDLRVWPSELLECSQDLCASYKRAQYDTDCAHVHIKHTDLRYRGIAEKNYPAVVLKLWQIWIDLRKMKSTSDLS